mgnify:CR=1 FL=1
MIEGLGGQAHIAELLNERTGIRISPQAVGNWRRQRIPYRWRSTIAAICAERGIAVPAGFTMPRAHA